MNIPFLKITFPELAHLSETDRQAIVTSCMETDAAKALGRRCMTNMRMCWALLVLAPLSVLVLSQLDVDPRLIGLVATGIFLVGILGLLLCIYVYHVRLRELLRRLIAERMNRARHEA
jgi:uncharacterized membrane protein YqjE